MLLFRVNKQFRQAAERMLTDYDCRKPNQIFAENSTGWLTLSDAYRIQGLVRDLRVSRGEKNCGYKIGCLSPAIQQQLGLSQPVRGFLWEGECYFSGARLHASQYVN